MGWQEDFLRMAMGFGQGAPGAPPGGGLPSSPLGGPIDPFGAALGSTGIPGMPSGGLPPSPFGGGAGQWPSGVPNPFGIPSPAEMAQTVGGWFSNPYGTNGSVANPSPWNGINPYGTQVSGGKSPWPDPGKPNRDPFYQNAFHGGTTGGFSTSNRPNDPFASGDTAHTPTHAGWNTPKAPPILKPAGWQGPQHSQTLDRWGGGVGVGGFGGLRHQQGVANVGGPPNWHDVPLWAPAPGGKK